MWFGSFLIFLIGCSSAFGYSFKCNGRIGQYPNPGNPYSFFKCDSSGRAHIFYCAKGTIYDKRTQICDWTDKVVGKSQGGYVDGTWDNYNRQPGNSNCGYAANGRYYCNNPPINNDRLNSVKMDCSQYNGPVKLYQNPDDCTTYYTCNMGYPVLTYCPRGLNFNPRRGGCDDTVQLGCKVRTQYQQGGSAIYEY